MVAISLFAMVLAGAVTCGVLTPSGTWHLSLDGFALIVAAAVAAGILLDLFGSARDRLAPRLRRTAAAAVVAVVAAAVAVEPALAAPGADPFAGVENLLSETSSRAIDVVRVGGILMFAVLGIMFIFGRRNLGMLFGCLGGLVIAGLAEPIVDFVLGAI